MGCFPAERAGTLLENLRRLSGTTQQMLDNEAVVRAIAEEYVDGDAYFFIGRQLGSSVALEGALKHKEISHPHAEGFPAGELNQGTLALDP